MNTPSPAANKNRQSLPSQLPPTLLRASMLGIAVSGSLSEAAQADDVVLPTMTVEGTADPESANRQHLNLDLYATPVQDIPQAIDTIEQAQLQDQSITRLQDALRNVPGITMNSGEGGGHGDSVNLRGLAVQNGFFMDGMRDPGSYTRDSFNLESVNVIKGPSSTLFGYGSTAGLVNQVSKLPTLAPSNTFEVKGGTNNLIRSTGDANAVINDDIAARITVMGERSAVADRDFVLNQRFGLAPSIAFGMNGPTKLTLSYLHQEENNIPDYGIPFLNGQVAPVSRSNYYGLANYDHTQTNTNVATAIFEHAFNTNFKLTNTLRYGNYGFDYRVTAPTLGNDDNAAPPPGTPLNQLLAYRDQPSSAGATTLLAERINLSSTFATGMLRHSLATGLGLSRETMNTSRYANQNELLTPTSLLNPNALQADPFPQQVASQPSSRGDNVNLYALDTVHVTDQWDIIGGLNFDRFNANFNEPLSGVAYSKTNTLVSPRAALVYKPLATHSYYLSYGTSYNPAIQYLSLAPSSSSLEPQKTTNYEVGGKLSLLKGMLSLNGALFQIEADNVRVADPNDPTVQAASFNQRVRGLELTLNGRLTRNWEINTGYTHLAATIVAGTEPDEVGKVAANIPSNTFNLWTAYTPFRGWKVGAGVYAYGARYASPDNTTNMPGYMLWNAMTSYQLSHYCDLQLNLDNLTNKYYFQSAYFSSASESHAIPGPGRTAMLTVKFYF